MQMVLRLTLLNLIVAIAYVAAGLASHSLALPHDPIAPVWLPAAIALAALMIGGVKLLPAIVLGSFAIHFHIITELPSSETIVDIQRSVPILAAGHILQAAFGAWLVRRYLYLPSPMTQLQDIFTLITAGGMVASAIGAAITSTTHVYAGILPESLWQHHAFSAWLSYVAAIAFFAPVIVMLLHPHVSTLRKLLTMLPVSLIIMLSVFAFLATLNEKQAAKHEQLDAVARDIQHTVEKNMQAAKNILTATRHLYDASEFVSEDEFALFTRDYIKRFPATEEFSWHPVIKHSERAEFRDRIRNKGHKDYIVRNPADSKAAPQRDTYAPAAYVTPPSATDEHIGEDLYGNDSFRLALAHARNSQMPVIGGHEKHINGIRLIQAVYDKENAALTTANRQPYGYLSGVFLTDVLLQDAIRRATQSGVNFTIRDLTYDDWPQVFHADSGCGSDCNGESITLLSMIGNHQWELSVTSNTSVSNDYYALKLMLGGALLLCSTLVIAILLITAPLDKATNSVQVRAAHSVYRSTMLLSLVIASVCMLFSIVIWHELNKQETETLYALLQEHSALEENGLRIHIHASINALRRMANRVATKGEMQEPIWRNDAAKLVDDDPALRVIQWIGSDHYIRHIEPLAGNEAAINLNIAFDKKRRKALKHAQTEGLITITPPLQLVQGYVGVIVYAPVHFDGKFQGFISGIIDVSQLIETITPEKSAQLFHMYLSDGEQPLHHIKTPNHQHHDTNQLSITRDMMFYNRTWHMYINATDAFYEKFGSPLASLALAGGLLFSLLIGSAVYYAMVSGRVSALLQEKTLALSASEEQFRSAMEAAPIGMALMTPEGMILHANKAFTDMLGYTQEEIKLAEFFSFTNEDDAKAGQDAIQQMTQGQMETSQAELCYQHKNGDAVSAQLSMSLLWHRNGKPKYIIAQTQDITARKTAENRLKDALSFQRIVMHHIPDCIFVKDEAYRIVEANDAFINLYPADKQNMIIGYTTLESYTESQAEQFLASDKKAFETGYAEVTETIATPDGMKRMMHIQKIRFENEAGQRFLLALGRDVTEREQLIERLSASNEELSRFAWVCSHDLQEPLRMVRSFSDRLRHHLQSSGVTDEKAMRYFGFIEDGAKRSQELIADILAYSGLDRETTPAEMVDMNELLNGIHEMMKERLDTEGASLVWQELPGIYGNKTQLYQLFQNLITNGLKYQKPGNPAVVTVSAADKGEYWEFAVTDNGIGIEQKHVEKVFEVFKRLHHREEYAGTGVGLAICRKVVRQHGGEITVESKKDKGSVFRFTLLKDNPS